jgi:uncharacterized protein
MAEDGRGSHCAAFGLAGTAGWRRMGGGGWAAEDGRRRMGGGGGLGCHGWGRAWTNRRNPGQCRRAMAGQLDVAVVEDLEGLEAAEWDALLDQEELPSPFVEHRFLLSLQRAGVLGEANGWLPRFPIVRRDGRLVAAAPAYVKFHSHGEFVFDFAWAEFAQRTGRPYYPKLLVGVPFTPVTGARLLVGQGPEQDLYRRTLVQTLQAMTEGLGLSSIHVNFVGQSDLSILKEAGFASRLGMQYHWSRYDQTSYQEYLDRFSSKRRNQLKRERKGCDGFTIETLREDQLNATMADLAHRLYLTTVDKFAWGRRYLNRSVFESWFDGHRDQVEFVVARNAHKDVVAGAVNFVKDRRVYGRYWGAFEEHRFLHFAVCYYHTIDECLRRSIDGFEPGAQGEHKLVRGFEPVLTYSAHAILDPVLRGPIERHLDLEGQEMLSRYDAFREAYAGKSESKG